MLDRHADAGQDSAHVIPSDLDQLIADKAHRARGDMPTHPARGHLGLSKREYIAALAFASVAEGVSNPKRAAARAVLAADALLAALEATASSDDEVKSLREAIGLIRVAIGDDRETVTPETAWVAFQKLNATIVAIRQICDRVAPG